MKTSTKFPTIRVEGWISVNKRGLIPADRRIKHPQLKHGFPVVSKTPDMVPSIYHARKVLVTLEDLGE